MSDDSLVDPADSRLVEANAGPGRPHIGIALSGGGHRASLFSAGALLGLVDAGLGRDAVSVASVSGGSITNGLVAVGCDLQTVSSEEFERVLKASMPAFCSRGIIFPGLSTNNYVRVTFGLLGLAGGSWLWAGLCLAGINRHWDLFGRAWLPVGVLTGLVLLFLGRGGRSGRRGSDEWAGWRSALGVGLLISLFLVIPMLWLSRSASGWSGSLAAVGCLAVPVALSGVALSQFGRRSAAVDKAMQTEFFGDTSLANVDRPVHHVFCATDLQTADHAYFSPRMVYGYNLGFSKPSGRFLLSTAVQASACLPGAFAPRRLAAGDMTEGPLNFSRVVVTDGGVYDNMADQWEFGMANRRRTLRSRLQIDLADLQQDPADVLLVVNAGGVFKERPLSGRGLLLEVTALSRCRDVLYDVSTSTRRLMLVGTFMRNADGARHASSSATASGDGSDGSMGGTLVQIGQAATKVPDTRARSSDPVTNQRGLKAQRLLAHLAEVDGLDWAAMQETCSRVRTTLGPIAPSVAVQLLQHGYTLARINTFLNAGLGDIPDPADEVEVQHWRRARFEAIAHGEVATT